MVQLRVTLRIYLNITYFSTMSRFSREVLTMGVSLPKRVYQEIDAQRGDIPRSRYILKILEECLEREKETQNEE